MKKKLLLGFTSPGSIPLIRGQVQYFSEKYHVYLMCPHSEKVVQFCNDEGCTHVNIPIKREISLFYDLISLMLIIGKLFKIKPDIINVGTPKMGLLATIAASLLRIPLRIYTCRGLSYQLKTGFTKNILKSTEYLSGKLAHHVICVGPALREKAIKDKVFSENKTIVIASGGSNGVNIDVFNSESVDPRVVTHLRSKYKLIDKFIFGFVGRMADRKGVNELYEAFDKVHAIHSNTVLLWAGSIDRQQLSNSTLPDLVKNHSGIVFLGWQDNIPAIMSLMDIFVIPSWWEGFGNVHIQAAAMDLPVITTKGIGCHDAVNNGYNATVIEINDQKALQIAMLNYIENPQLKKNHSTNSRKWAEKFDNKIIWKGLERFYNEKS